MCPTLHSIHLLYYPTTWYQSGRPRAAAAHASARRPREGIDLPGDGSISVSSAAAFFIVSSSSTRVKQQQSALAADLVAPFLVVLYHRRRHPRVPTVPHRPPPRPAPSPGPQVVANTPPSPTSTTPPATVDAATADVDHGRCGVIGAAQGTGDPSLPAPPAFARRPLLLHVAITCDCVPGYNNFYNQSSSSMRLCHQASGCRCVALLGP
uniref:Uncharacterized protein n=1 Tax=Oryza nivara TaxID=4536 RepID=A0A0E0G1T8_ORYNI